MLILSEHKRKGAWKSPRSNLREPVTTGVERFVENTLINQDPKSARTRRPSKKSESHYRLIRNKGGHAMGTLVVTMAGVM